MEKVYTVSKTRLGADCGSDHDLLIAKLRFKLKKVGKTTTPFRDDVNPIPYDYTVEVRNRFKGLDLTDIVPDELWMEFCDIVQGTGIKTFSFFGCKRYNQSDFSVDHLVMAMCRDFSCVLGRGCLL